MVDFRASNMLRDIKYDIWGIVKVTGEDKNKDQALFAIIWKISLKEKKGQYFLS